MTYIKLTLGEALNTSRRLTSTSLISNLMKTWVNKMNKKEKRRSPCLDPLVLLGIRQTINENKKVIYRSLSYSAFWYDDLPTLTKAV